MIDLEVARIANDIKKIKIQGASKIELAALSVVRDFIERSKLFGNDFLGELVININHLMVQRANEPKLRNSLTYIWKIANKYSELKDRNILLEHINNYQNNISKGNETISEYASQLITNGTTILTHCHSNLVERALIKAYDNGVDFEVYCTETRPRYQGRITANALCKHGIKTTQIVDSAVSSYLKKVDFFLTGADVVLHDGSLINKIGTHTISIAAKHFKTPHVVLTSTHCVESDIFVSFGQKIEERDSNEIWEEKERPKNLKINNPSFDVTPAELIDKFITEEGVFSPETLVLWNKRKT